MSIKTKGKVTYVKPIWQRFTAYLMSCLMLLQICLPATVQAVELISDSFIESDVNSNSQFERVYNSNRQFEKAFYIEDAIGTNTQTIELFHQKLLAFRKSALHSPQMIPIINNGITIIIPNYPLGKRIGDQYVQARFVRSQIFNLLNRNLLNDSYSTEVEQINDLYNQAYQFSATSSAKFGDKITRAQVNSFGHNFIWPETRLVNNEAVLVPVVHLTDATVTELLVNSHRVEFSGAEAKFNTITVNAGTIYTRRGTFISTAGNFTVNEGASVVAKGDLNLLVGGTLQNLSGRFSAKDNVNIIANQYQQKTMVHRYATKYEQGTRLGQIASVDAVNGNISIRSHGDLVVAGGTISGNNIVLAANGNIQLTTQFTTYNRSEPVGGYHETQNIIEHIGSRLSAKDNIMLLASGAIEITASKLISDSGYLRILAEQGVYIGNEFNQFESSRSGKVRKVTLQEQQFQTIAIRTALEAGRDVLISSDLGDVTLKATEIKTVDGTQLNARNGKVNLLLAKEQDSYFYNWIKKTTWKIKTETIQNQTDTAVYNAIVGGIKIQATHGVTLDIAQKEGQTLQDVLAQMAATDDLAWMNDLYNDPDYAENIELIYQKLEELRIHKKTSNLSPAAMAIIAIAVAVAMGPAAFGLTGTGAGAIGTGTIGSALTSIGIPAVSLQAGAVALATQAATALASGKGIDGAIKHLVAEDSLRSLATSMVTAGVVNDLINDVGVDFFGKVNPDAALLSKDTLVSLGNQATQAVVRATVTAGLSTVIQGRSLEDFGDSFTASLKSTGINTLGEYMASSIGKAYRAGDINNVMRYLAHAGSGCVLGLASSSAGTTNGNAQESCITGAGGAVAGEATADIYKAQKLEQFGKEQTQLVEGFKAAGLSNAQIEAVFLSDSAQNYFNARVAEFSAAGVDLAKLSGGLSALVAGGDVNLAALSAENAAQNNAFFLIPIALMLLKAIDLALTANELHDIYTELQNNPENGQKLLQEWLLDQAGGAIIGKVIPGFKSMEEMLDWLKRNDVLTADTVSKITSQVHHSGGSTTTNNRIDVYDATHNKLDLKDVTNKEFITSMEIGHWTPNGKNDGFLGEYIALDVMNNATGLQFTDIVRNGSNNGPDLLAIDHVNKTVWLVEAKSSIRDKFPNPNSLNLSIRGQQWLQEVKNNGTISGKSVTPAAREMVRETLKTGYPIKPFLATVKVPLVGTSGTVTVNLTPAK
ncbi:DUF637 domain-containing protein [Shewanella sp. S-1]|uniref:DUF637 domain-containing protein n=1 Tax=Shewanella oncorhynchi TaxID=2726434 RepID=A0ABX1KTF1_9GAMM|nr:DUF637 domain-containing protein [Shewanella oncorhynchi]NLQ24597.1 DUF637 domain-containing protein [Shewanella oncorhynchi]